jgi:hypothetical protein
LFGFWIVSLARIQSPDLPDEAHQALDKVVLKIFKLYTKHNEVPDWDALLFSIVNNDKRLSPLSVEEAAELLKYTGFYHSGVREGVE